MDMFDALQRAFIRDLDGNVIGKAIGFSIEDNKLTIRVATFPDEYEEDDDDDPEKEDIPEPVEFPKLRAVSGEKQN